MVQVEKIGILNKLCNYTKYHDYLFTGEIPKFLPVLAFDRVDTAQNGCQPRITAFDGAKTQK